MAAQLEALVRLFKTRLDALAQTTCPQAVHSERLCIGKVASGSLLRAQLLDLCAREQPGRLSKVALRRLATPSATL